MLYGEFNGQSLTGGRRVIIVNDAGNDLTKAIRKMLDESPNTGNLLILSGAGSLNKKSSLVKLAEDSEDMAAVALLRGQERRHLFGFKKHGNDF